MEGFTHLIPFAAGHEVIRQQRRDLTLVRMTPDLIYDQLIGAGCASRLVFSWGGNPGVGSLHRLRDAVEHGWPRPLALEEFSHGAMANAYDAGAANLPFAAFRTHPGGLADVNPRYRTVTCPVHRRDARRGAGAPAGRHHHSRAESRPRGQRPHRGHRRRSEGSGARRAARGRHGRRSRRQLRRRASQRVHPAALDDSRDRGRAGRRISVVRLRLLRARQRVLSKLGRDLAHPRHFHGLARRARDARRGRRPLPREVGGSRDDRLPYTPTR